MNEAIKKALDEIEIPAELHALTEDSIMQAVSERRISIMKRSVIKIAAIAAAVAVIALGSVTVAAFSGVEGAEKVLGFSGKNRAFGSAATYVVENAETEEERDYLANMILAGLTYDINSEDSEVTLGFSGLRPAYTVRFKVGGHAYEVVVDARTEVVLDCKSTVDENWESYVNDELGNHEIVSDFYCGYEVVKPDVAVGQTVDYDEYDAMYVVKDYYGLDAPDGEICKDGWNGQVAASYENPTVYITQLCHGGYIYENRYDPSTGEITELYVGEDKDYSGSDVHKHLHAASDRIGSYGAIKIAREEGYARSAVVYIADYTLDDGTTTDIYAASSVDVSEGEPRTVTLYIDAYSGEIVQRNFSDVKTGAEAMAEAPTLPSAEPPEEGLISEAEAAAAVLEREDASLQTVADFSISYDGEQKVYTVTFVTEKGAGHAVTAEVDAASGKIID